MKRSCESEEEREIKQVKVNQEIPEFSSDSDSDSETEAILSDSNDFTEFPYVPINEESFVPSLIEKQIVRQTLSLITKSNMSDWACEIKENTMMLRNVGVIVNNEEGFPLDIVVEIDYNPLNTYIKILYSIDGQERQNIYLKWETEFIGNHESFDIINITKYVEKSFFLFFTKTVIQSSNFNPRERENEWCYFYDARMHLNRISM